MVVDFGTGPRLSCRLSLLIRPRHATAASINNTHTNTHTTDTQTKIGRTRAHNSFITVSMTVGPASGVLKSKPQSEWTAREVALTVLIDRSTARLSTGQRTALNDVESAKTERRAPAGGGDGTFYVFEHLSQGSPTAADRSQETFRHALAATTVRLGQDGETPYLYTLNLSCPEPLWGDMRPQFEAALSQFRLEAPTRDYVAPDKDPWHFW